MVDLIGKKYWKLQIVGSAEPYVDSRGGKNRRVTCKCDCGKKTTPIFRDLISGHTKSCGCTRGDSIKRHGMTGSKEHRIWSGMKKRCLNKNSLIYKYYGGRGIKICDRWMEFENFFEDMGECPDNCSLDRINNDGNYEKSNCRWATRNEQHRNMSDNVKFNGECAIDASRRLGGNIHMVAQRVKSGWSVERAFTEKPLKRDTK